ncbi:hypothetical protein EMIHUDRAFT_120095 [Emiliania huxleyi CCMP1516]|uniref:Uncharacterized protein n=2 Tax=Emiliania huxleyi TaxID=2903 RepID=A0A0D3IMM8_EMIH1|nr:hypothetical protein EMIHUDRAFT_120095 [Emiliania huxleyi CCMP1516]EOD12513.1 hypothetical protein EMIHUDRAFT_120095 [Emiliania huxleyi CCMP1516]|eukprot:XP_005764942.1 hypothetical protein EMIHUDRAFT_120095 [Emiliania huxleyi CCMP1516]
MGKLARCQGRGSLWLVGSYVRCSMPLLENGVTSAIEVAKRLGVDVSDIEYVESRQAKPQPAGGRLVWRTAASRPASLRPRGGPDGASLAAAEEGGGEYAPFEEGGGGGGGDADAAPTPPPAIATAVAGAPPDFRQRQQ